MRRNIVLTLVFLGFLIILLASFSVGEDGITGEVTQPTNLTISVSSIEADWISNITSPMSIVEGGVENVVFYFTATIEDGNADDINDSSARSNFTKPGETTRENLSCSWLEDLDINPPDGTNDTANYSCTIGIWYWDSAGTWTVTAAIADNNGNWASNNTVEFNLSETTAFVLSPSILSWQTLRPGDANQTAYNDPTLINNTGNDDIEASGVEVNALNMHGETNSSHYIDSADFSADIETGGNSECDGTGLSNDTYIGISGSLLPAGNNSMNYGNATSGQEQLYYCLTQVKSNLTAQTYSTAYLGAWYVQIT